MITKSKKEVRIPMKEWKALKDNPVFAEMIELLEDLNDLDKARKQKGKDVTLEEYLVNRGLSNNH